jgi:hypothetical protein
MLLSAVSLFITMLLWPPTSPAGPEKAGSGGAKSCAELMNDIYKQVEFKDLHDYLQNELKKASVQGKAQEYINNTLPAFKAACPTEAKSIKDLENGNYLKKLAAERKKRNKAWSHVKGAGGYTGTAGQDEDLEDLEIQR